MWGRCGTMWDHLATAAAPRGCCRGGDRDRVDVGRCGITLPSRRAASIDVACAARERMCVDLYVLVCTDRLIDVQVPPRLAARFDVKAPPCRLACDQRPRHRILSRRGRRPALCCILAGQPTLAVHRTSPGFVSWCICAVHHSLRT